jgi:hypothetical protein
MKHNAPNKVPARIVNQTIVIGLVSFVVALVFLYVMESRDLSFNQLIRVFRTYRHRRWLANGSFLAHCAGSQFTQLTQRRNKTKAPRITKGRSSASMPPQNQYEMALRSQARWHFEFTDTSQTRSASQPICATIGMNEK